jgi:deoxyribodipyrimidine photo-lyase
VAARLAFLPDDPRVRLWNEHPVRTARGGAELVLYWMQIQRRPTDNAALAYAIARANELGLPCVVYESVRPDYPYASDRLHTFLLESARDVARGLEDRGLAHAFFLPRTPDEARGVLARVAARAALVVTDEYPSFIVSAQTGALARRASCPVLSIDDCAVVPLALFPKAETAARTLRPKMTRLLPDWLRPLDEPAPARPPPARLDLPFEPLDVRRADIPALVASCRIDHSVPPVAELPGGARAAAARLRAFLDRGLPRYAEDRNDPAAQATSHLSPYLHFGSISARAVALRVQAAAAQARLRPSAEAFLEQLLVRRGLAFNFARTTADHARYTAIPAWAREALAAREVDPQYRRITLEDLREARTPDPLWNAAQTELRTRGVVQGYARMLWGKLPIAWMPSAEQAHAALVEYNDRYALDGRDPDGYANIAWCFGLHDRPWPKRPGFGAVRAMTSRSARAKYDFEGYIARWSAGPAALR